MKLPKTFLLDKCLDKKTEELIKGYQDRIQREKLNEKILDMMLKLDMNRGILYTALAPFEFEQSNLPYEKVSYVSIACAKQGEKFYRYRFNYRSKGEGLKWLEIVDTKQLRPDVEFDNVAGEVLDYYKNKNIAIAGYRKKLNKYTLKFNSPHAKEGLKEVVDNFYSKKFCYLGTKYCLFINKVVYKGLAEDEFLHSNLPLKHVEFRWKNRKGI